MTALAVDPVGYAVAAHTIGGEIAGTVEVIADDLFAALSSCYGMAGTDDAGLSWAHAYDPGACSAANAFTDLGNAAYCVAALLERSGINYAGADAACVPGETAPQSAARWAASSAVAVGDPPSAAGAGLPEPAGWSMLQHLIGRLWPDGHQDLLHRASDAWHSAAAGLLQMLGDFDGAITRVSEQRAPEVADATVVLNGLRARLVELADNCSSMGRACSAYAHDLDRAHSEIVRECADFLNTTIAAEAAGGLLAVVTVGASEVLAQGAVAAVAWRAAETIKGVLEALSAGAVAVAADLDAAAFRLAAVSRELRPTLARRVQAAEVVRPGIAGQTWPAVAPDATGNLAIQRLTEYTEEWASVGPAARTWGNLETLPEHFRAHGSDFGATSPGDYARQAAIFFRTALRERLPAKIDRLEGTIRFYDPESGTFGSYRLDGRTRSFFKPRAGERYWSKQRGELVHG